MEDEKKRIMVMLCFFLVMGMFQFFDTSRYIKSNIKTIDKADGIYIMTRGKSSSYPFDDRLIKLLSYGGFVVKVDSFFVELFAPYRNKLTKIDMSIGYTKGERTLATADVYRSNEDEEKYFLYLNNVYWSTNSKLIDLFELIE